MAEGMDKLDVWLPAEFLTDDDLLTDFKIESKTRADFSYGFGSLFGFTTDLSFPVPSAAGTTETESDEDDSVSELTRNLAGWTLRYSSLSSESEGWKSPGSPQSTLRGCKAVQKFVYGVCNPQDGQDARRWDLLCAAAEEAARMRMIEETEAFYSTKSIPLAKSQQNPNPIPNFYGMNHQTLTSTMHHGYHQLQAARFQLMKKQQMLRNGGGGRPKGPSMAGWPTLQQPGSGMTAVFLGETGRKKERTGTGVFMPRRFGSNPTDPRKKSGCSTVLLPDKVVHALNLNLDPIVHPRLHGYDAASVLKQRNTNTAILRSIGGQAATGGNQELRLPQEWTY